MRRKDVDVGRPCLWWRTSLMARSLLYKSPATYNLAHTFRAVGTQQTVKAEHSSPFQGTQGDTGVLNPGTHDQRTGADSPPRSR